MVRQPSYVSDPKPQVQVVLKLEFDDVDPQVNELRVSSLLNRAEMLKMRLISRSDSLLVTIPEGWTK